MSLSLGAALGIGAGSSVLSSALNFLGGNLSFDKQISASKDLLDYQQEKYLSPKAQVKNLAAAGINPAAAFGNTSPVNVGGELAMPTAPNYNFSGATQSLSDVASLLVGAAQAKKAGVEVPNIEAETQGQVLDNQRKEFENKLLTTYGLRRTAAEVALAEQNVKNAFQTGDNLKIDNSIKEWQSAKEKALSECNEVQRDILKKEFENKDTELQLRNRKSEEEIKTEKSKQSANYASAEASRSSASNYREQARINTVLADIQEATSDEQIKSQLSKLSSEKAISDKDYQDALQKLEALSRMRDGGIRQVSDDFLIWLKEQY